MPKRSFLLAPVAIALTSCATAPAADSWETIFDGETLSGWIPKINGQAPGQDDRSIFRVEDGVLKVSYEEYDAFDGAFGHLYFEDELSQYRLRFDYRFTGEQAAGGPGWAIMNSGVMVHSQAIETMALDQPFPVSVEAQLLGAFETPSTRTTANICTPGTHIEIDGELVTQHCIDSQTLAAPAGEWVSFELEVDAARRMTLRINGADAFTLNRPQYDDTDAETQRLGRSGLVNRGYFALQAESHPVEFRNIQLLRLD